jgi:hypothetical protein
MRKEGPGKKYTVRFARARKPKNKQKQTVTCWPNRDKVCKNTEVFHAYQS